MDPQTNGNLQHPTTTLKTKATKPPKIDEPGAALIAPPSTLDLSTPVELKMVRMAMPLNQQDGGKALVVGHYMANGGKVDGVVSRMVWYPGSGAVVATVTKRARVGSGVESSDRYIIIQGDMECEVLA